MLLQRFDCPVQQVAGDVQVILRNKDGKFASAEVSRVAEVLFDSGVDWLEGIVGKRRIFHWFMNILREQNRM